MPRKAVVELVKLCHERDVLVSTGGFIERVLTYGPEAVHQYISESKQIGFDIIEISTGFITVPVDRGPPNKEIIFDSSYSQLI